MVCVWSVNWVVIEGLKVIHLRKTDNFFTWRRKEVKKGIKSARVSFRYTEAS